VANQASDDVTVIDGASHNTRTVNVGSFPVDVAVNSLTNKVYVPNRNGTSGITVIDGGNLSTKFVPFGGMLFEVALDEVTNKIYITNGGRARLSRRYHSRQRCIFVGKVPVGIAVDSKTNRIYVANHSDNTVSVILEAPSHK
jgi:YVTN family beta-propeller protein